MPELSGPLLVGLALVAFPLLAALGAAVVAWVVTRFFLCQSNYHDWQAVYRGTQHTPSFEAANIEVSVWRCFRCARTRQESWTHSS